jgi:hypothetical protein
LPEIVTDGHSHHISYLGLCHAGGLDRGHEAASALMSANLGMAALVSIVHSGAMIAAGGLCAWLVYRIWIAYAFAALSL